MRPYRPAPPERSEVILAAMQHAFHVAKNIRLALSGISESSVSVLSMLAEMRSRIRGQAWRTVHPPARGLWYLGRQPLVHKGFLETWKVNGLDARVLAKAGDVLADAKVSPADFQVLITGEPRSPSVCADDARQTEFCLSGCPTCKAKRCFNPQEELLSHLSGTSPNAHRHQKHSSWHTVLLLLGCRPLLGRSAGNIGGVRHPKGARTLARPARVHLRGPTHWQPRIRARLRSLRPAHLAHHQ